MKRYISREKRKRERKRKRFEKFAGIIGLNYRGAREGKRFSERKSR